MAFNKKILTLLFVAIPCAVYSACDGSWLTNGAGTWDNAANWSCEPTTTGDDAELGTPPTGPVTITLDTTPTITDLVFDNANTYTLIPMGFNQILFDNVSGSTSISVLQGQHVMNVPVSFPSNSPLEISISDSASLKMGSVLGIPNKPSLIHFLGSGQWIVENGHVDTTQLQSSGGTIFIHNTAISPLSASVASDSSVTIADTAITLLNQKALVSSGSPGAILAILNGDLVLDTSALFITNVASVSGTSGGGSAVAVSNGNFILNGNSISILNTGPISSSGTTISGSSMSVSGNFILNSGDVLLDNSNTLSGMQGASCIIDAGNHFIMNGGSLSCSNTAAVTISNGSAVDVSSNTGSVVINDGSVFLSNTGSTTTTGAVGLGSRNGDFTVNGGTIVCVNQGAITGSGSGTTLAANLGNFTINNGTLGLTNSGNVMDGTGAVLTGNNITVNGGSLSLTNLASLSGLNANGTQFSGTDFTLNGGNVFFTNEGIIGGGGAGVVGFVQNNFVMNGGTFLLDNHANIVDGLGTVLIVQGDTTIHQGVFTIKSLGQVGMMSAGSALMGDAILVTGGLLVNDATLSGVTLTIEPQGTFAGKGYNFDANSMDMNISVTNGGTVIPGDPGLGAFPGVMTIQGSYTQLPSGIFVANLLNGTTFSQLDVFGPVQVDGTIEVAVTPGYDINPGVRFPVILGDDVSGVFSQLINFNLPPTLTPHVEYFLDRVVIFFTPSTGRYVKLNQPVFSSINQTNIRLQTEMQSLRTRFGKQTKTPPQPKVQSREESSMQFSLQKESTLAVSRPEGMHKQFSGINFPWISAKTVEEEKTQRLVESLPSVQERPGNWYIGPKGQKGNVVSKEDAQGYKEWSAGAFVGYDYAFSQVGLGVLVEYERISSHVGKEWGKFKVDNAHGSLYSTYAPSGHPEFSIQAIIGGGYERYRIYRNIGNAAGQVAEGTSNAKEFDSYLGIEYSFRQSRFPEGLQIIPLASIEYMYLFIPKYTEKGAGPFNLSVSSQRAKSLRPTLGLRVNQTWDWENVSFSPELIALWQRECLDKNRNVHFTPVDFSDASFALTMPKTGRNIALIGADFLVMLFKRHGLEAGYTLEYNSLYHTHFAYMSYNIRI